MTATTPGDGRPWTSSRLRRRAVRAHRPRRRVPVLPPAAHGRTRAAGRAHPAAPAVGRHDPHPGHAAGARLHGRRGPARHPRTGHHGARGAAGPHPSDIRADDGPRPRTRRRKDGLRLLRPRRPHGHRRVRARGPRPVPRGGAQPGRRVLPRLRQPLLGLQPRLVGRHGEGRVPRDVRRPRRARDLRARNLPHLRRPATGFQPVPQHTHAELRLPLLAHHGLAAAGAGRAAERLRCAGRPARLLDRDRPGER